MTIVFEVDGQRVEFTRNGVTGRAGLLVDGEHLSLQSPWNPLTHWSLGRVRTWKATIRGRGVVIEKRRPALFAGFRPHAYRVLVDGLVVAEREGH